MKRAIRFATDAHQGQVRKLNGEAYIVHPIAVGNLLKAAGFAEDVVIAGYLHDTVEDTFITFEDIRREFGDQIVQLVKGNTEDKTLSWKERKEHTIETIKNASLEIKALIIADKLDNIKSIINNYDNLGESIWEHFKGGPKEQKWYYSSVLHAAFNEVPEEKIPDFFYQLKQSIHNLFGS